MSSVCLYVKTSESRTGVKTSESRTGVKTSESRTGEGVPTQMAVIVFSTHIKTGGGTHIVKKHFQDTSPTHTKQ